MGRTRALAVLLALSLALTAVPVAAQAPPTGGESLAHLFAADTVGYLELQLRPGGEAGARLERLLGLFRDQPADDAQWAWLRLVPRLARTAAAGIATREETPDAVAAVAADDAGALLSLILVGRQQPPPTETYAGVPIYALEGRGPDGFVATVGRYLLAASSRDALVAAIDRARAGPSAGPGLGGAPGYQAAIARLPPNRVATGYLDGAGFADWMEQRVAPARPTMPHVPGLPAELPPGFPSGALPPGFPAEALPPGVPTEALPPGFPSGALPPELGPGAARPTPPSGLPMGMPGSLAMSALGGWTRGLQGVSAGLEAYRAGSMALAVTAEREGLRMVLEQPAAMVAAVPSPSTGAALQRVPSDAIFAIAGYGVASSMRPSTAEDLARLQETLPGGIDLQRDLLEWMDGEYGIAVLPPAPAPAPGSGAPGPGAAGRRGGTPPTFLALFEVRDPPAVEARLRDLTRRLAAELRLPRAEPVEERQGDVLVRRLPLATETALTWGYLGNWLFVTTGSADPLARAADSGGLTQRPGYNRLAQLLPAPHGGIYYFDLGGLGDFLGARTSGPLAQAGGDDRLWRELLDLLGPLAGATGLPRDGWLQHTALLEIRW